MQNYSDDTVAAMTGSGFTYSHTGGGIMAWSKEDREKDLFVYLGADNPSEGLESPAGIDVMNFAGAHRYSRNFPTLREAMEYAGRLFEPDSRERFRQDMIRWLESQDRDGDFSDEASAAQGMRPITVEDGIEIATTWAKDQLSGDVNTGRVPLTVRSFSQLHDHVDANGYGGAFDWPCLPSEQRDDAYQQAFADFWNAVQGNVDRWIGSGEMRAQLTRSRGRQ
jgi:hypothetical protein